ncbi:enterochelin esterase [Roseateles sp. PN1]|uniref:enterochelin esterase n=1 Tax=Roseateles sp. PN1 TaxID=3137372 RepID=UPI003139C287
MRTFFCTLLLALALPAAATQPLLISAAAGDYVVASLRLAEAGVLELRGPGQQLLRRQAAPAGESDFRFVAGEAGSYLASLAGPQAQASFALIEQRPLAGQVPEAAPPEAPLDSPKLQALASELGAGTPAFWAAVEALGMPLIEPLSDNPQGWRVSFLWRGHATTRSVRLFWPVRQGDQERFARVAGTDVWHYSLRLPSGTRLAYQLAPDVPQLKGGSRQAQRRAILARVQADPLNPRRWTAGTPALPGFDNRLAEHSLLELPGAPAEPWLAPRAEVARGSLEHFPFKSQQLGNERRLTVYRPAQAPAGPLPLLLLFDEDAYLSRVPTPTILDNLIAAGRIPPLLAVLVGNPTRDSRSDELPCNPRFADMLAGELLPWLAARYPITADPARTVVAGSSYGGLASAWLGLRHPQRFGRVLSLSGSFWWAPARPPGFVSGGLDDVAEGEWLTRQFVAAPRSEVQFYLAPGLLERSAPADGPGILETNRHLRDVLQARGQHVIYREFGGGHDYVNWRSELAEGLIALLGQP